MTLEVEFTRFHRFITLDGGSKFLESGDRRDSLLDYEGPICSENRKNIFSGKNPSYAEIESYYVDVDLSSDFSCPMVPCLDSDASSNLV